jgi:hypothetical protein
VALFGIGYSGYLDMALETVIPLLSLLRAVASMPGPDTKVDRERYTPEDQTPDRSAGPERQDGKVPYRP